MLTHPIPPVSDENSRVLILGSFPSVKSREQRFFYGHPRNRFWTVTAAVFGEPVPQTVEEKRAFLLRNHVAVWDVIESCEITGSADNTIKNVKPNDLSVILKNAKIETIFVNGKTAERYYKQFLAKATNVPMLTLPSTSPANAAWSVEKLIDAWKIIRKEAR